MKIPVIAVFDIGKTNKKLLLFNEHYQVVFEQSRNLAEAVDEDGFPCEDLDSLKLFVLNTMRSVFRDPCFDIKAVNFSSYGASLVYLDENGQPLTPLYNYLKPYPDELLEQFYSKYGGKEEFAYKTASPVLGSLNSGMQLYRIKYERPELLQKIKTVLHLPQYLSYLISGKLVTDITSIGCHTNFWDFSKNEYHQWLRDEGLMDKLAPIAASDERIETSFEGHVFDAGIGLHDSSAAIIPYLISFTEPFVLISTGTWCISLNPFNASPLTKEELESDCLCYLQYKGTPVKASRLFAGHEHEQEVNRIAEYYHQPKSRFEEMSFDKSLLKLENEGENEQDFSKQDLSDFESDAAAYHHLILSLVRKQKRSTQLIISGSNVNRIFVDGGFSKNSIYMNLLSFMFPEMEVFAASMAQATAMGTALVVHRSFGDIPTPNDLIELKFYSGK
ncbi:Sugar (pentulose or hexulose) kinase [Daejeonella rubra]|uniref:Sugar (Pentulose or hexulose) kinase n=1 Tax=Daejeonella rubra TaxID=990371 RepID=A0A1G9RTS3_9SPHI|nr:FGGY family carbohydrate kinase [Daejeonella rubra]SDM26480.1 Sugar (pentulose or hexulose) kinase [Daejeonella rubra]